MAKVQIKRGNKIDIPALSDGEFGLCQDTGELFIGNGGTNLLVNGGGSSPSISSYLAFAGNVNSDMLDAAFGKNNEESINEIGNQLAMFGWFKGDSKITFPFTNLKTKDNLSQIRTDKLSCDEIAKSPNLIQLVNNSPYAVDNFANIIPLAPAGRSLECAAGTILNPNTTNNTVGAMSGSWQSPVEQIVIPKNGVYNLYANFRARSKNGGYMQLDILVNGISVGIYNSTDISTDSYGSEGKINAKLNLKKDDILSFKFKAYPNDIYLRSGIFISLESLILNNTLATGSGKYLVHKLSSFMTPNGGYMTSYSEQYVIPRNGLYTIQLTGNLYSLQSGGGTNVSLIKNGSKLQDIIASLTSNGTESGYYGVPGSVTVNLAQGDIIKISADSGANSSQRVMVTGIHIYTTSPNTFLDNAI